MDVGACEHSVREVRNVVAIMRTPHGTPPPHTMNAQEQFWGGDFGNEYVKRSPGNVEANTEFFKHVVGWYSRSRDHSVVRDVKSVIEFGAGVGNNLRALRYVLHGAEMTGIELNAAAFAELSKDFPSSVNCSMLDWYVPTPRHELSFTKGVLIHIKPEDLPRAYAALYGNSRRYVLIAEYYNPAPVEIEYRGQRGVLWKRDFAGEMLDLYDNLRLIDYGFVYHRDEAPQDDLTWFLMEKR